jgi:tRNA threonylcarbamoyladenosine biosynthesis protein TsaB
MKLLAIDCSTERLSLAVADGDQRWEHAGEGGAQASAALLPAIMGLLDKAQLSLQALDAIAFGRGPGAFTGLRTACAVAQGLALGANLPLVPVDTLLMLAVAARSPSPRVLSVLDARMGQVYVAAYEYTAQAWVCLQAPMLSSPSALQLPTTWQAQDFALASNAHALYGDAFAVAFSQGGFAVPAWPNALALLDLAAVAYARGETVTPAQALPLYVRDKVALTTAERAADSAARSA